VAWLWAASLLWDTTVPGELELPELDPESVFDPATVREAEDYEALVRWLFIASQVALVVVLAVYTRRGARFAGESAAGPIGTGFLIGMMGLALVWLAQLPFGLVELWWSRRHDVVEIGYVDYVVEDFLALGGEFLFVCVALLVTMALARLLRSSWWLPATAVFVALAALFALVAPYLTPGLEQPDVSIAADARRLARTEGLPSVPVRVQEVREFTNAPNAYAFGLGDTRRVVLWDTLAEGDFSRREVRSVIAHELGHHEHDHIAKRIGWFALLVLPAALAVAVATRRRGLADPAAVPIALFVVVVLSLLATPLQSATSRRYEAEADWAALQATRDPRAMESLHRQFTAELLADPDPPGWFAFLFDSHPSGLDRAAMARAWRGFSGSARAPVQRRRSLGVQDSGQLRAGPDVELAVGVRD
jgi:STE24 endopeptidase